MSWVQPRFAPDGQLILSPMIGPWEQYEHGSEKWAEAVATHLQLSVRRSLNDGDPVSVLIVLGEAVLSDTKPWTVWPEEAKGNPETWVQLVTGQRWEDIAHLVKTRKGADAWEPFAQALQKWEAHPEHGRKPGNPTGANQYSGGTGSDTSSSSDERDHTEARGIRRRLQKRADAGDQQAAELVSQLTAGDISVNQAAIAVGMRAEYLRVPKADPTKAAASIVERMDRHWCIALAAAIAEHVRDAGVKP